MARVAELPPPPVGRSGWPWTEGTPIGTSGGILRQDEWPKITVVTISFDQAEFLEETIRSVLLQNYPNLEYIIVDGGSVDDSIKIIRRYEDHIDSWVSETDKGQSHALNKGFARATGNIHAFLNGDDIYEPGALWACAREFEKGHKWIFGQVRYYRADVGYWQVPQLPGRRFTDWFVTCPISQPGCFWAAELAHAAGPFREELSSFLDYEYWLRLRFREGIEPKAIDDRIAVYRLHADSKTVALKSKFAQEGKELRREYRRYLGYRQRAWLWIVKRHRRGRARGARAVALLQDGQRMAAARQLLAAVATWPLLVVDRGIFMGISQLRRRSDRDKSPEVWPEWDD